MLERDHGLSPPLGLEHVGEVFGAGAEDAAVRAEHLAVHHERHVAVRALLQQPARRHRGNRGSVNRRLNIGFYSTATGT